ncbi:MAG: bifunctional glutamate N-acetyltransferase/amino-acid acetyltransferase ArgJ [Pseudomonadota bacterium]
MIMKISPLAPSPHPRLDALEGVRVGAVEAGIKYSCRKDLSALVFDKGATVAGVFTKSKSPSAPVDWCREQLATGDTARVVVINSGNANAFTGSAGIETVEKTAAAAAAACGCKPSQVYIASTGVIGEPLNADGFTHHLAPLCKNAEGDGWANAADAIMTTDTYPKLATSSFELGGHSVKINGIAKGSGMIAPDMATMLSFIATDLSVDRSILQQVLSELTDTTFNAITVDSDTSTSDTVMLFATGESPAAPIAETNDARLPAFRSALHKVMQDLALQIVRDGEGATKEVAIIVTGAEHDAAAKRIAFAIANSPLVKTAIAGEDANWGRIVMAVGKAGEKAERDRLSISFGDIRVAHEGMRDPDYSEEAASAVMKNDQISISVDVGVGQGKAKVWTCDLTKQYVAINGDYRS